MDSDPWIRNLFERSMDPRLFMDPDPLDPLTSLPRDSNQNFNHHISVTKHQFVTNKHSKITLTQICCSIKKTVFKNLVSEKS